MNGEKVSGFPQRISQLVNESGRSATQIASDLGVAKQTISAWKTGQNAPKQPTVYTLSAYFDVSITWLMGYDVPMRGEEAAPYNTPEYKLIAREAGKLAPEDQRKLIDMMKVMFNTIDAQEDK